MSDSAIATSTPERSPAARQLWDLIKQELLYLCWALMEVALITPFAIFIMRWTQFWSPSLLALWLLLLMLLPFNLVRLLSTLGLSLRQQRRLIFLALVLALLISWRGLLYAPRPPGDWSWLSEFYSHLGDLGNPLWGRDISIFLFGLLAWWRGLRLAQFTPDIYRAGFRLRLGVLLLAPLGVILFEMGNLWGATPFVLLYFLAGLTALALIRAEQIERERSGFSASLTPRWVATIFLTSLLTVLTAGIVAAALSGETAVLLTGRLAPLWHALMVLFAVSLSTVIYLLSPLFALLGLFITALSNLFTQLFAAANLPLAAEQAPGEDALNAFNELISESNPISFTLPPTLLSVLTVTIMALAALIIVFFLTRAFRQPRTAPPAGSATGGQEAGKQPAGDIGGRILQRLGFMRRWRAAASIRRIYIRMCDTAESAGYGRGEAETPYEYLTTLAHVWPGNNADCRLITEAYVRVRYGEIPETAAELKAIQDAWRRLLDQTSQEA